MNHCPSLKRVAEITDRLASQTTQNEDRDDGAFVGIVGAGFIIVMALVIGVAME